MYYQSLNGMWNMEGAGFQCTGTIPGSVYSFLLENSLMDDPYYRDNELYAQKIVDNEFEFFRLFDYTSTGHTVLLRCEGLDTLCDIFINKVHIAYSDNMHRIYEFDITEVLKSGRNEIRIVFHSVDKYIKEKQKEEFLIGPWHCMDGAGHIRKAHCMMGWDWGPRLPDVGIWRNIGLVIYDSARITDFNIIQYHESEQVYVRTEVKTNIETDVTITMLTPSGKKLALNNNQKILIEDPELWWPNGLGKQPLYSVIAEIKVDGKTVDRQEKRIGLRTLKLIREKDSYGECFCHEVNGIRFFAMGADYIPEDNILSRITPERTRWLIKQCQDCHFNAIRVWGGGYYPDDYFYDTCDEMGLIVFQDLMTACTTISGKEEAKNNFLMEVWDNLIRIRHHASLALICGNNEIEEMLVGEKKEVTTPDMLAAYLDIYERKVPAIMAEVCPDIDYVPSSPSSCGHFLEPTNENYGDCHYWEVWHGDKPFSEYRNRYFRYLSEFGFQSFPGEKTIHEFTLEEDRNIFSRVMEMHQRNGVANGKILRYLSDTFLYPHDFGTLLYASQLLQAEAIRYGVEHLRRNRGRCMGALYWQLNDIYPVASWSSIDYYGRYKALQYVAKRFFNPIMISCKEIGEKTTRPIVTLEHKLHDFETKAQLCVTNESMEKVNGLIRWALRDRSSNIIQSGEIDVEVPSFTSVWMEELDFCKTDVDHTYMSYEFIADQKIISEGTVLFTAPKYFQFLNPELSAEINGDEITVFAKSYAKYVEIDSLDSDFILSDNYFDMNAGIKKVKILEGIPKTLTLRSVYDIR